MHGRSASLFCLQLIAACLLSLELDPLCNILSQRLLGHPLLRRPEVVPCIIYSFSVHFPSFHNVSEVRESFLSPCGIRRHVVYFFVGHAVNEIYEVRQQIIYLVERQLSEGDEMYHIDIPGLAGR